MNSKTTSATSSVAAETPSLILSEKDITQEELREIASFPILWPTYVPDGFPFQRAGGFSSNINNKIVNSDFVLHYGTGADKWLAIRQGVSISGVRLTNYELIDRVPVNDELVSIYERTTNKVGPTTIFYCQINGVTLFIDAIGMSKPEMVKVISSLQPR